MSAIKIRKRLTKFKITIALPKKFGSKGFITIVKVINPFTPGFLKWTILSLNVDMSTNINPFTPEFHKRTFLSLNVDMSTDANRSFNQKSKPEWQTM